MFVNTMTTKIEGKFSKVKVFAEIQQCILFGEGCALCNPMHGKTYRVVLKWQGFLWDVVIEVFGDKRPKRNNSDARKWKLGR